MIDKRLPSAVIFDMDGLLVDTEPMHGESYARTFAEYGLELGLEEYRQAVTIGKMGARELYLAIGGNESKWHEVSVIKAKEFGRIFENNGYLMPGVLNLLESLKQANIPAAIATSAGRRSLGIVMDKFNLVPYFDHLVTWNDVEAQKPDPDVFIEAARRIGVRNEDCVALEDSPRGVLAAYRAGMKCIAVPTSSSADGDFSLATLVVNSLEEVTIDRLRQLFTPSV